MCLAAAAYPSASRPAGPPRRRVSIDTLYGRPDQRAVQEENRRKMLEPLARYRGLLPPAPDPAPIAAGERDWLQDLRMSRGDLQKKSMYDKIYAQARGRLGHGSGVGGFVSLTAEETQTLDTADKARTSRSGGGYSSYGLAMTKAAERRAIGKAAEDAAAKKVAWAVTPAGQTSALIAGTLTLAQRRDLMKKRGYHMGLRTRA